MLYLDPKAKFSQTQEKPGYFVGFAHNVGDHLTFKILKNDMRTVLHRSVVRSANDPGHRNKRVHFKSDMEQVITGMDARTPRTHKRRTWRLMLRKLKTTSLPGLDHRII